MPSNKKRVLPIHPLNSNCFAIEDITYNNSYDFSEKHRHEYFEFILIKDGGGMQIIDFTEIELTNFSCYLILPKQVHLLKRNKTTTGIVLQFTEDCIKDNSLVSKIIALNKSILFENNKHFFGESMQYVNLLAAITTSKNPYQEIIVTNLVHSLVYHLLGYFPKKNSLTNTTIHQQFIQLVEDNYTQWHTVSEYVNQLTISESKLSRITKTHFGQTPLQIIHTRLILEIKRLLFLKSISIKEISYRLGFEYPSNFAQFIKNKTGYTATQLQQQIKDTL